MLNLFKLPFRVRQSALDGDRMSADFTAGIVANYLRHRKNLSGEELDQACNLAMREMEILRREFQSSPGPVDNYDLMTAALRRIDDGLRG